MSQKKSPRGAGRHSALGRGLGALIPTQVDEVNVEESSQVHPLDVFFPARPNTTARQRGGSAKGLLVPKAATSKTSTSRKTRVSSSGSPLTELEPPARELQEVAEVEETAPRSPNKKASDATHTSTKMLGSTGSKPRTTHYNAEAQREVSAKSRFASQQDLSTTAKKTDAMLEEQTSTTAEKRSGTGSSSTAEEQPRAALSSVLLDDALKDASAQSCNSVSRETSDELLPVPGASFAEIPLSYIVPNTRQPREVFDEDDLAELRDSVLEVGILQPIVVRPIDFTADMSKRLEESLEEKPEARFELIMGERRLRAAELAGLDRVPAIIRQTEDQDLLRDALLENLHRAQLNPLEEASAYQQLMADFGATQEELSKKIARSRPQIANTLRLLKLPPTVQKKVAAQVISAGHARALLSLETVEDMELLADRIVAEGLSVRTTEELVRLGRAKAAPRPRTRTRPVISALGEQVVSALQDAYETRVSITEGAKKGRIVIEFAGPEDLRRIADLISAQH